MLDAMQLTMHSMTCTTWHCKACHIRHGDKVQDEQLGTNGHYPLANGRQANGRQYPNGAYRDTTAVIPESLPLQQLCDH